MPSLVDRVSGAIRTPRPTCIACGRAVGPRDDTMRLRGGGQIHRSCATYVMRRKRTGVDRLGYPLR